MHRQGTVPNHASSRRAKLRRRLSVPSSSLEYLIYCSLLVLSQSKYGMAYPALWKECRLPEEADMPQSTHLQIESDSK